MDDKRDYSNLTDHYLTFQETHRIASNLNRIEAERERQKNPTTIDFVLWLLGGIIAAPFIVYVAFELLTSSSTIFEFIFILGVALLALWIDICFILRSWNLLKR